MIRFRISSLHISLVALTLIIFLGSGLEPAHADDANGISIQNISVQPYAVKVRDTFTITATLVNNSTIPTFIKHGACEDLFSIIFDNHVTVNKQSGTCTMQLLRQKLGSGHKITETSPSHSFLTYHATATGATNATITLSYSIINQTDPNQSTIEKTISKSFLFTIYDENTNVATLNHGEHSVKNSIASPLKQIKSGVAAKDVVCKSNLQLVIKAEDGSPACVKPSSVQKLVERGWAKLVQ